MALDRFVYWKGELPTKEQLEKTVFDYAKGINPNEAPLWLRDRWIIPLLGAPSYVSNKARADAWTDERWIEIWPDDHCVDVITRLADDITNAIAEGLAKLLTRMFDGRYEGP